MKNPVKICLEPLGVQFSCEKGTHLQNLLFEYGVEFPCGGHGRCKGCRIRILEGDLAITEKDLQVLGPDAVNAGWRLACAAYAENDLRIELAQWKPEVLSDETSFAFTPGEGFGIAVDIGTTTIVAQLVDLQTAQVIGVRTALNPQARHGADVMSRVEFAVTGKGRSLLTSLIRDRLGKMIHELVKNHSPIPEVKRVVCVGNTVMHHLFCDFDLSPLSAYPFETEQDGLWTEQTANLGWDIPGNPVVRFLPCLGGFVGSDILAGIMATGMLHFPGTVVLVDLGTNGEIVIGNNGKYLCASTAAGPAFEGARISMGMRASTGAIFRAEPNHESIHCSVIGDVEPKGICGSGLVDLASAMLQLGWISSGGRIRGGAPDVSIINPIKLTQTDIRELQLAKGAISAGIRILVERTGAALDGVQKVYLAGAFGNYIDLDSARRIGLLPFELEVIEPVGNAALRGARMALFHQDDELHFYDDILARCPHISLSSDERFMETYVEEMIFPVE